ncbi:MAG: CHAP domain-containing protein [bacterium]|nr:CHAP domain-containing protein [bacterium]
MNIKQAVFSFVKNCHQKLKPASLVSLIIITLLLPIFGPLNALAGRINDCVSTGYACVSGTGYKGVAAWGYPGPHNCTLYAAYRLAQNGYSNPSGLGNAYEWDERARSRGVLVNTTPAVGSIAQYDTNAGHVMYVEAVNSDHIVITEDNWGGGTKKARIYKNTVEWNRLEFLHFKDVNQTGFSGVGNATFRGNALNSGETLFQNQYLASSDLRHTLIFQTDGNLVIYNGSGAVWSAQTGGKGGVRLIVQSDGNLVLYNSANQPVWNTATFSNSLASLVMQDDGNLVLYGPGALWNTQTNTGNYGSYYGNFQLTSGQTLSKGQYIRSSDGRYALLLQHDGNLVLFSAGYHVLWHSGTGGSNAESLIMQNDGNLVLYRSYTPVWNTQTTGSGDRLVMQDDGNLVLYAVNTPRWHTSTGGKI